VAGVSRSWKEAVCFLKQLDVRLEETWSSDKATRRQKGISSLILRTERLQILDIEFTSSKAALEDMALQSGAVKSAVALDPQTLTTWLRHTKSSLTSLAVAVTSARQPVHHAYSLAEAIILHNRKSSCLQKLWLWQMELDVPSFQGPPSDITFPCLTAASLKPRCVTQGFLDHFLVQSPSLLRLNLELATMEEQLTFTSPSLQKVAITILPGSRVRRLQYSIVSLVRTMIQSPYPLELVNIPNSIHLAYFKLEVVPQDLDSLHDDFMQLLFPASASSLKGLTLHLPTLTWERTKSLTGPLPCLEQLALTRSMDAPLAASEIQVEEMVTGFPNLISLYLGESIFADMVGMGHPENWLGPSKWKALTYLRIATTSTSRDFVNALSRLLRKCPKLIKLEIARPFGCEEDRIAASTLGEHYSSLVMYHMIYKLVASVAAKVEN
jgi:hypothetical protein